MAPKNCHVLHVSWEYPPLIYGGLGRHVEELTRAQVRAGARVTVLTQHGPGERHPDYEVVAGVNVLRVDPPTPEVPMEPQALVQWTTKLDQRLAEVGSHLLREFSDEIGTPNIVHGHDWVVSAAAQQLATELNTKLITTFHATESGRHQGWIEGDVSTHIDRVENSLSHHSDQIIVCSEWMKNELRRQFRVSARRVAVIPNGINLETWSNNDLNSKLMQRLTKKYQLATTPLVLFAGRLEWEKGIQTFIDAAAILKDHKSIDTSKPTTPHFVIAGTGTLQQQFQEQATEANLNDILSFEGWLPPDEIKALIASASVVVVPSLYEPFGITALEAAALGAPLVVATSGGLAEIVDSGRTGRVFPPSNAPELAYQVAQAVDHPTSSQVMAQTLASELPDRFNWDIIARDTFSVYVS